MWSISLLMLACSGKGGDSAASCEPGPYKLTDANNFAYTGTLDAPSYPTAPATDITICWDQLTDDIQCHDVDPAADIDNIGLVRFPNLSEEDVEAGLSTDNLQQADISGYVEVANDGGTCANIASMSFFGTPIDVPSEYTADGGTYLLLLTSGTVPGVGARMIAFLDPTEGETATTVDVGSGCGSLDFTVDLDALTPMSVCNSGDVEFDWTGVTVDGQGNPINYMDIDQLMLGYYEGVTLADLESQFLDLELIATRKYTLALEGGTSANLADATDGTSNFSGFEGDGLWILALRCTQCSNPAPPFLTVLEPQ